MINVKYGILLTKPEALALVAFASTDEMRPHLNCVAFEPGFAVATDGCAIAVCEGTKAPTLEATIFVRRAVLERAAKACGKKSSIMIMPGTVGVLDARDVLDARVFADDPPLDVRKWMRVAFDVIAEEGMRAVAWREVLNYVVPTKSSSSCHLMNPKFLALLALVGEATSPQIVIYTGDSRDPVFWSTTNSIGSTWRGAIMPYLQTPPPWRAVPAAAEPPAPPPAPPVPVVAPVASPPSVTALPPPVST